MPEAPIEFEGLRCRACGTLDPGPRELCAACHSAELDPCKVAGSGSLVSWTTIRRAPTRFKGQAPYTIAVVDLDAGVRVTGRLRGDLERLKVGSPVAAVALESGAYMFEETRV
ncbi:Zn-ribbon domain-containing OB-fold protein [Enterovirga sp. CN4-39]|uniref:Zn-ribbon domain-containing OB-fold protein n=1 Tax=Enterovirga sp. CN4-39 TaxID=3400910 RepID=UPI003C07DB57